MKYEMCVLASSELWEVGSAGTSDLQSRKGAQNFTESQILFWFGRSNNTAVAYKYQLWKSFNISNTYLYW